MNSYTFVPKIQNLSSQQGSQPSKILQRLQQLKQSMRPAESLQQEYSSIPANSNPGQHNSAVQNQRLFQYLPKETEEWLSNKKNQQGMEDYESYRKSLEKKLNYLFEREKHIMKTQSTYQPLNPNQPISDEYLINGEAHKPQYTDELQKKYKKLQQKQVSLIAIDPKSLHTETNEQRSYKVHSTIETNYLYKPQLYCQKDQEIDQMQRKIKMLEIKYLGNYSQQSESPNQFDIGNRRQGKIALSTISEVAHKNHCKNFNQTKYRKEKTSPDKSKKKHNFEEKVSKPMGKNDKKLNLSSPNKKHPIKDYMNTIEYQKSEINEHNTIEADSILHKEFQSLKSQFHSLLQINKSMIQKVQLNEEQRVLKREKKQKAKAMLKEILFRLEEIKGQIKSQSNSNFKTLKNKDYGLERIKSKSQCKVRFQKSSKGLEEKQKIEKTIINQAKNGMHSNKSKEIIPSKEEIQKLKKLLNLEAQHRHIVQKKLEAFQGNEFLTQNE